MNFLPALWEPALREMCKASMTEKWLKMGELRDIAYKASGWITRRAMDDEPVELARIVVRPR